jgi:hypothetical protein
VDACWKVLESDDEVAVGRFGGDNYRATPAARICEDKYIRKVRATEDKDLDRIENPFQDKDLVSSFNLLRLKRGRQICRGTRAAFPQDVSGLPPII